MNREEIVNEKDLGLLIEKDALFSLIYDKYGLPPNWSRPPGFVSLVQIILEQQVSLASARAHFNKLNNYLPDLTPQHILQLSDKEMRNCQISWQKASYLKALSSALMNGELELETLADLPGAGIRKQLTAIKGIGNWTADIYQMFCLQHKDIFPSGDIAVVNTIRELTNLNDLDEIASRAEDWKPFRSLAAYLLWHYYLCKRNSTGIDDV
jgi:DNA-3-methyladenine glycosylase II